MGRKRASLEVAGESIPRLEDIATLLYVATPEGDWPVKPSNYIRGDLPWLTEGAVVSVKNLDPTSGEMGATHTLQVAQVLTEVQLHQGKYGQVLRKVLLVDALGDDELSDRFMGRR
ncbi:MAG: hypothetical protein SFU83_23630 [Meiothermus sp.]|nr:hypothetical protein [Meiothermus sp.]